MMPCECCGCTTKYRVSFRKKYPDGWPNHDGWYRCVERGRNNNFDQTDIDHIVPKSAGGPNCCIRNLQPMCVHCNRQERPRRLRPEGKAESKDATRAAQALEPPLWLSWMAM
eukprot:XP_001695157.1 predicted protein [Chlamydomonas reinhardtii]